MTTTALPTPFAYVDCDLGDDQTLVEWRREQDALHRHARRSRRPRVTHLFPRLRPAT